MYRNLSYWNNSLESFLKHALKIYLEFSIKCLKRLFDCIYTLDINSI